MDKGGVKPPYGSTYVPEVPDTKTGTGQPLVNAKPQISRQPDQTSQKNLLQRNVAPLINTIPQVNRKMRQKLALSVDCEHMQAERQSLAIQHRIAQQLDQLKDAVFNQNPNAGNFTIYHIDENGQEVAIIPPDPAMLADPNKQVWLLNHLQQDLLALDEHFSDDAVEELEDSLRLLDEQLEDAEAQLNELNGEIPKQRPVPDFLYLDLQWLTTHQPEPDYPQKSPAPSQRKNTFALGTNPVKKSVQFEEASNDDDKEETWQWLNFNNDPTYKIPRQYLSLAEIRSLSEEQMEERDDFIPLLFPHRERSEFNPGAPILTDEMLAAITSKNNLREEIGDSMDRMLEFWGLERDDDDNILIVQGDEERHKRWLTTDKTVDQQRISHVLNFLMDIGQFSLADNLEKTLQDHLQAHQLPENESWSEAISRKDRNPPPVPGSTTVTTQPKEHKVHSYKEYVQAYPYKSSQQKPRVEFYHKNANFYEFTNFYKPVKPINIDGVDWPTTEHYFQACKFTPGSKPWNDIRNIPDAGDVYRYVHPQGKPAPPISMPAQEWDVKKDAIMIKALRHKAIQVEEFREKLLSTGSKILYDTSDVDSYWGTAIDPKTGAEGKNHLGAMLMQIRDELIASGWKPK